MQDLANFVLTLLLCALLAGPTAILISKIRTKSLIALLLKRSIQGIFILLGTVIGVIWIFIEGIPFFIHILGALSLITTAIAVRNEYMPKARFRRKVIKKM
jgi:hypothetical protein